MYFKNFLARIFVSSNLHEGVDCFDEKNTHVPWREINVIIEEQWKIRYLDL